MVLRILFVNAIDANSEVETRYPNLGLGYLIGSLRSYFGPDVFDFKIIDRNFKKAISSYGPDIVCLTSVTQNYNIAKKYAQVAKQYNIPVLVGGVHISMLPQSLSRDMDIGCVGEGEKTIVDLLTVFNQKRDFPSVALAGIPGIVYWQDEKLIHNPLRQPVANLDEIPVPARDLLSIERHSYMFTSRGCPYNCIFCASTRFWSKVRFFSAEYVIAEIEELVNIHNVKLISFFDDLFIANVPRLRKIVKLLEEKSFYGKIQFTCSARANLITAEVAKLMQEMPVRSVGMGLESGSDKTLKFLKGGNVSVADNVRAIKILKEYRIAANGSFVIGSPQETEEDILKTYHFIKNNPLSLFDTYVLTPFPGTEIWEYAKKRKAVTDDMDWDRLNVNFNVNPEKAIVLSEVLSRQEILKLYRKFQSLRLFKNARNVWFTPQFVDLPKVLLKTCLGYLKRIFNRGGG